MNEAVIMKTGAAGGVSESRLSGIVRRAEGGGVLFEIATAEPGFARDEAPEALGTALKLPVQHERLRARIEAMLEPIVDRPAGEESRP